MERFLFVTMRFIYLVLLSVLSCHLAFAQELPSKIRGYPVHKTPIVVADTLAANESTDTPAVVKLGEPDVTDVSLTGITFELQGEITSLTQSGKVDFLTFHGFEVNGIPVQIEEYAFPFTFRRNEPAALPMPATVFLPTSTILKAAWQEMQESQKEWIVTGRVFVFGKFRKYGFHHKRVVPVDINVRIGNPLLR